MFYSWRISYVHAMGSPHILTMDLTPNSCKMCPHLPFPSKFVSFFVFITYQVQFVLPNSMF